jgi:hypothetical protein
MSWAIIEATNLWAGFLRAYYLSASGRARTASGHRITFAASTFPNFQGALKYAVLQWDPKFKKPSVTRRDEPPWHNTKNFLSLFNKLGASNLAGVHKALAYSTTFYELLPTIRNFYAHRCDETFRKAGNVGIKLGLSAVPNLHATEIMCSKLSKRPYNVATDWLDDIGNVIDLLCA